MLRTLIGNKLLVSLQMPDAQHCADLRTHSAMTRSVQAVGLHLQRRPETHQVYHPEGAATKEEMIQTPSFGVECANKWQKSVQSWPADQTLDDMVWLQAAAALRTNRGQTFHWSAALSDIRGRAGDLGVKIKSHLDKLGLLPEPVTAGYGGLDIRQPAPKPAVGQPDVPALQLVQPANVERKVKLSKFNYLNQHLTLQADETISLVTDGLPTEHLAQTGVEGRQRVDVSVLPLDVGNLPSDPVPPYSSALQHDEPATGNMLASGNPPALETSDPTLAPTINFRWTVDKEEEENNNQVTRLVKR